MKNKTAGVISPGVLIAPTETPFIPQEAKDKIKEMENQRIRKYKAERFN